MAAVSSRSDQKANSVVQLVLGGTPYLLLTEGDWVDDLRDALIQVQERRVPLPAFFSVIAQRFGVTWTFEHWAMAASLVGEDRPSLLRRLQLLCGYAPMIVLPRGIQYAFMGDLQSELVFCLDLSAGKRFDIASDGQRASAVLVHEYHSRVDVQVTDIGVKVEYTNTAGRVWETFWFPGRLESDLSAAIERATRAYDVGARWPYGAVHYRRPAEMVTALRQLRTDARLDPAGL